MFRLVVRKELLESLLSFRFTIAFPMMVMVMGISVLIGLNEYRAHLRAYSSIVQLNRDQLERSTDWRQVGQQGIFISAPPSPLMVFALGMSGIVGQAARITDRDVPVLEKGRFFAHSTFAFFGGWDLHFVVKIVLSLMALLFAYDAVSGEKEMGTLRVLLSNPIPRSHLILGKAVGRFLVLATAFGVAFLSGLIVLFVEGDLTYTAEHRLRILLILVGSLLYIGVFFALGLMASCLTTHSVISLLLSLCLWVVVMFAVPKASLAMAGLLHPVPTAAEFEAKRAALAKDMYVKLELSLAEPTRRWMRRPAQDVPPEELYRRQMEYEKEVGRLRQLNEAEHAERLQRLYEEYRGAQRALDRIAARLSRLSPAACYDYFITELAETGPRDVEAFLDQALTYQKTFGRFISDMKLGQEIVYIVYAQEDPFKQTRPDLSKIPPFEFKARPWPERWRAALGDVALLWVYAILFFLIGYVRFLVYDPR
jgi:ABC-type transport system involved in multi-copper enzyme maturation permease subunit